MYGFNTPQKFPVYPLVLQNDENAARFAYIPDNGCERKCPSFDLLFQFGLRCSKKKECSVWKKLQAT